MRRQSLAVATILALLGCGGDSSATNPFNIELPTDFPVTVTSGTTPTISWTGKNATSFSIQDQSTNTITDDNTWYFFSANDNVGVASPVVYGKFPAGASCGLASGTGYCPNAIPLVKGHKYLLIILTADFHAGEKAFSP